MPNPTIESLLSRRSVRAIDMIEPGPDAAALETILTVGLRVPDHGKRAPWRLHVIEGEARERLGELFERRFRDKEPGLSEEKYQMERERPLRAPVIIAVIGCIRRIEKIPAFEQRMSAAAVCQNILNAAHALGFAAQWITEWPAYDPIVRQAFGHKPNDDIVGFIYLGSAAEKTEDRARPAIVDVVNYWQAPE